MDYYRILVAVCSPKDPKTTKKIIVTLLLAFTYIKDNKTQVDNALASILQLADVSENIAKKISEIEMEIEVLKAEHNK